MKKKDLNNLRGKNVKDLQKQVDKLRGDLVKEKAEFKAGKSTNPKKSRSLKKDIAQITTLMQEKQIYEVSQKEEGEK